MNDGSQISMSAFIGGRPPQLLSNLHQYVPQHILAATITTILGAGYMLWLVQRIFYGPESAMAVSQNVSDLRLHEIAVLAPLAALMLVML